MIIFHCRPSLKIIKSVRQNLCNNRIIDYDAKQNIHQQIGKTIHFQKKLFQSFLKNHINRALFFYSTSNQKSNLQAYQNIQSKSNTNLNIQNKSHMRCNACNVILQSQTIKKFGYIQPRILQQAIQINIQLIKKTYTPKIQSKEQNMMKIMHEVEKQTGNNIFNHKTKKLQNLDNVQVLLKLQQKIDIYQRQSQLLHKNKNQRKQILCYRCYSIKHHNRLPEQYDSPDFDPSKNQQYTLNRVFHRHNKQQTHFFYMVDILDIAGSLQFQLFQKLFRSEYEFSIILNKIDIVNKRYLNINLLRERVKNTIQDYLRKLGSQNIQVPIYMISNSTKDGLKKLKQFLQSGKIKRIQLLGLPNTGKTSLLNSLILQKIITSNIPGTTTHVTQHIYKNKLKIYDMPGIYYPSLLYNLISKPNLKSILTWDKFYSPPLLTHSAIFYGGKVQLFGCRIIVFGHGGCISANNQWFMKNYKQFWKGLPQLNQLDIVKYQRVIKFRNGQTDDLQIQGFGFISFKIGDQRKNDSSQKLTFYLPRIVKFRFSKSVLSKDKIFHIKDAFKKQHMLSRLKLKKTIKTHKTNSKKDN